MTVVGPQWLRTVAGPHALSLPTWLLLGVPTIIGGVTILAGGLGRGLLWSLGWGIVAWLALGAVWLLARFTWMSGGSLRRREVLIVPTYVLGGAARAGVFAALADSVSVRATIAVSVVNVTVFSIILAVVVDRLRNLNLAAGRLDSIRAGLVDAGARAMRESAQLRASAREAILAGVREALRHSGDAVTLAEGLRGVSERVVRPLSHDLAAASPGVDTDDYVRPRRDLRSVARAMLDAGPIRPAITTLLYCAYALPVTSFIHGWPSAIVVLGFTAISVLALLGMASLIPWRRLSTVVGCALLGLVLSVTGAVSVLILRVGPMPIGSLVGAVGYAAVFLMIIGGCIAVLQGLAARQRQIEESLIVAARERAEVVRVEQGRLRRDRRHLARVLHGVVQPRLVARALQLQGPDASLDVAGLEMEIVSLLSKEAGSLEAVDLSRALHDVAEIWEDSVAISVAVPAGIAAVLNSYPPCALAIGEVACEAVNNAVLRGGAQRVDVRVEMDGATVRLTVVNDFEAIPHRLGPPGMGSEIYGELADDWGISADGEAFEFWADFSLDPGGSTGIGGSGGSGGAGSGVLTDHAVREDSPEV